MTVFPMLLPGLKSYTIPEWSEFRQGDSSLAKDYLNLLKGFNYRENLSFYYGKAALPKPEIEKRSTLESTGDAIADLSGKKIAIDLTPMLPGSDSGVKLMTLELVHALADLLPKTSFVLLTAEASHAELILLENEHSNIQRKCILHSNITTEASLPKPAPGLIWMAAVIDPLQAMARRVLPQALKQHIKRWRWGTKSTAESAEFLRETKMDLLYCPFTAPFYADPLIPTVSLIYDLQYRSYPQFFNSEELIKREDNFKTACEKANFLVATSEFVRKTVIDTANLSPKRVIAIPIGLLRTPEQPIHRIAGDQILEGYGLRHGEYIFYPANFWPHKNHAMLLTAFNIYRQAQPDSPLKLICTGAPGTGAEAFCEAANRMGLADWVIYPGYITSDEYNYLLRSAFSLIFPSLYEGFGIPVLEAMAAGVPVLCSNITSLPEVGGDAVLYFDPRRPTQIADALRRLSEEPGLREGQIARGLQRWLQFGDVDRMAGQYADVFATAIYPNFRKYKTISSVYPEEWTK